MTTAPGDDDTRTIASDGTQTEGQGPLGADRSRGPAVSGGGEQEPGGPVPPYEGRKETAEADQEGGTYRDGARVGGATGPVADDQPKAADPSDTPGGRTTSPSEEQPAAQTPGGAPSDPGSDAPAHTPGTPRGEKGGA
jgi:hypothetical protein